MSRFHLAFFYLLVAVTTVKAFSVGLEPHGSECYFENMKAGEVMSISFESSSDTPNVVIDFTIVSSERGTLISQLDKEYGTETVQSTKDEKVTFCFSNERWSTADKEVSFNAHLGRKTESATPSTDPLEKEIETFANGINQIRDEQEYIVTRERQHRDTAESTNSRVMYWSITETFVLVTVCLWQVWYLRRFFEVKRVV